MFGQWTQGVTNNTQKSLLLLWLFNDFIIPLEIFFVPSQKKIKFHDNRQLLPVPNYNFITIIWNSKSTSRKFVTFYNNFFHDRCLAKKYSQSDNQFPYHGWFTLTKKDKTFIKSKFCFFIKIMIVQLKEEHDHPMAYFCVQLRAVASYLALSVLYMWAISGTSGSSGLGSVNSEQMDKRT